MKIQKLFAGVVLLACVLSAKANYTIEFTTYDGNEGPSFTSHTAYDVGGTTPLGAGFLGQLYVGPRGGVLAPIGTPQVFGLPNAPDGHIGVGELQITDPNLFLNSAADYRLRAWSSAVGGTSITSYEQALTVNNAHVGESAITAITLGGSPPPPALPVAAIANLHPSFTLAVVPEPSVLALGLLGGAALLFRRRK